MWLKFKQGVHHKMPPARLQLLLSIPVIGGLVQKRCSIPKPLGAHTALKSSLADHLQAVNATLDPREQLQCIIIVTTAWTVDNGIITPTFRVKRHRIEEIYAANYERWEASGKKMIWQAD
ncbi:MULTISPECIES: hypothetical protein [unclassified Polaromonas]|uniref:hypothetical protein n=1 Tax=unclassified Polaromonas TaxID=2638319 RepID=UPI0018CA452E|nr:MULTISPECIES: hypothetical protein [unclassified Polaromonas]MBG6072325.1 hypothetical protein [Polaromonas sp. CG_9.7]MBG6114244.1 hypothetical protein [Polaromonas sp. CG_9.2]MDH6182798.1 hypothetical protein [Polaromonas sp. CG_23.6]